jgi:hypothetical protein
MLTLAGIVLVFLLITTALGVMSLARWLRHARASVPPAKVVPHVALQVTAIGVWIAFLATGSALLAGAAFIVITPGMVFGDLLMFASYRAGSGDTGRIAYGAVAAKLIRFQRPVAALHAIVGALGYFTMLVTAIWAIVD